MPYAHLSQRGLIAITGDDAPAYLQGLISNDVHKLSEEQALYTALLSPQGKFLHDFFLMRHGDVIFLDIDASRLPDLLARLKMYKLRSKVTLEPLPDTMGVVAVWDAETGIGMADPRVPQLGRRIVGDVAASDTLCQQAGLQRVDEDAYERLRLEWAVPEGSRDMIIDRSILLEFGFEDLHGVDFKKGCYVGQEVTARSKYRGQLKKHVYQVRALSGLLPETGTPVMLDGVAAGELRSHIGNVGLAVLRVSEVQKNVEFRCGNAICKALLPQWVAQPPKALEKDE